MLELDSQLLEARDQIRLEELLAQGADINAKDDKGWGVLHYLAKRGDKEILEYLLVTQCGINDIDLKTQKGETPLYIAAQNGQPEVARLLIERGADVNSVDNVLGATPLHVAKLEVAKLLLAHGANVNARNAHGSTPLHYLSPYARANNPVGDKNFNGVKEL